MIWLVAQITFVSTSGGLIADTTSLQITQYCSVGIVIELKLLSSLDNVEHNQQVLVTYLHIVHSARGLITTGLGTWKHSPSLATCFC